MVHQICDTDTQKMCTLKRRVIINIICLGYRMALYEINFIKAVFSL